MENKNKYEKPAIIMEEDMESKLLYGGCRVTGTGRGGDGCTIIPDLSA